MSDIIQLKRALAATWAAQNPVLAAGEPGYEKDTHFHKLGDGVSPWNDLEYERGPGSGSGDDSAAMLALQAHIASQTPHAILEFDWLGFYENVKAG